MFIDTILRFLHAVFLWFEGLGFRVTLRELRRAGHRIPRDSVFGRGIHLLCEDGSRLGFGSAVEIGPDSWIILDARDAMTVGDNVFVSQHVTLAGSITIGADSLIAGFVTILSDGHEFRDGTVPMRVQGGYKRPVVIGRDVWIGAGSVILPGVTIGDHAIVGANSTVTASVEPWTIVAGSPARRIGDREHDGNPRNDV